ncbi:MAG TPA: cupredoxin domain-containing protein [Solirubrobacteraceae bacterium]|jgi:plastocyanin
MPRPPITALACLALAGAAAVGGCGSSKKADSTSTPAAATPPATQPATAKGGVVNIAMKNIQFVPAAVKVKVGQKIVWTNDDGQIAHNVTDKGGSFASNNFTGGQTFSYTPKKAGTIDYECTIHPNQTGTITVTK